MRNQTLFHVKQIRASDIVKCALALRHLSYGENNEVFYNTRSGLWEGRLNCHGLFLQVSVMLELLDADFDLNLSPAIFQMDRAATLRKIIHLNLFPGQREAMWPGDLLFFKWLDVLPNLQEVHHAGFHVGGFDEDQHGSMIHAHDASSGGLNKIYVQRISALDFPRIHNVFRLKGVINDLWQA